MRRKMDRRGIGERSDAVLRTATPGDDGGANGDDGGVWGDEEEWTTAVCVDAVKAQP